MFLDNKIPRMAERIASIEERDNILIALGLLNGVQNS